MDNIIALVTVYFPLNKHLHNIEKISRQVDTLVICDNSPQNNFDMFKHIKNVKYYGFEKNNGLSKAFNIILQDINLLWNSNDFLIFFDQDTIIPENHIDRLKNEYIKLEKLGYRVGCIGPVFFNQSMQKIEIPRLKAKIDASIIKVKSVITSSMLCRYGNLQKIGFWNELLFLDMADWDVCWRFRESKMDCFMSSVSIIDHSVGEGKKRVLFFDLRIAKPFREYYQTRDCLYLITKDYVPWNFKLRFLLRLTIRPILHILFLEEPKNRFNYILLGIKDYFKNIHGEIR